MSERLMYLERVTPSHQGEAWVGFVTFSRSGATAYFNGRGFGHGRGGAYVDIESYESYWLTGVKKRGTNRHWAGSGPIHVERRAVPALLEHLGVQKLDPLRYVISDVAAPGARRAELHELENARLAP